MGSPQNNQRRDFMRAAGGAGCALIVGFALCNSAAADKKPDADAGVTAPEDLMKEHGLLNRCLLIYEACIDRLRNNEEVSANAFNHTALLIHSFVEEYHEKNEEKYIFPVFETHHKLTDLVATLRAQHIAGRAVTERIVQLSSPTQFRSAQNRQQLITACQSFIRMYRPHESREDTVLFPALRTILSARQVVDLGDRMEQDEHKVLGEMGFEKSVARVESIERALGIYDLKQFTPKLGAVPLTTRLP